VRGSGDGEGVLVRDGGKVSDDPMASSKAARMLFGNSDGMSGMRGLVPVCVAMSRASSCAASAAG
jgi:hypothetical protein